MLYLKCLFKLMARSGSVGLAFLLVSMMLPSMDLVFDHSIGDEFFHVEFNQYPYIDTIYDDEEVTDIIQNRMSRLPGVLSIESIPTEEIRQQQEHIKKNLKIELPELISNKKYYALRTYFESQLDNRKIILMRSYLSKLIENYQGVAGMPFIPEKLPQLNNLKNKMKWIFFGVAFLIWLMLFMSLAKNINNLGHILDQTHQCWGSSYRLMGHFFGLILFLHILAREVFWYNRWQMISIMLLGLILVFGMTFKKNRWQNY